MAGPALAIAGRGEEFIYKILSGSWAFVLDEGSDLFGSVEVAVKIDEEASGKSDTVGGGRKVEILLREFFLDEGVDGMSRGRDLWSGEYFKGPPVGIDGFCLGIGAGVGSAAFNPGDQDVYLFVR